MTGSSPSNTMVYDVTDATFERDVIERSHDVPVIVDFWAAWCGPCRTLGPMIEAAVAARDGNVVLAKVDVDHNQATAQAFRVQGIPQVYAFKDGKPVSQFTGVIPAPQLEQFIDALVPTEADRIVAHATQLPAEQAVGELERALALAPDHRPAALALARLLVETDPDRTRQLAAAHRPAPEAEALLARLDLLSADDVDLQALRHAAAASTATGDQLVQLGRGLAASGDHAEAIEALLSAIELADDHREPAREQLLSLFTLLGDDHALVRAARPRLARALF